MTNAITLAQFSDIHLSPIRGLSLRYTNAKRALGLLNWQRQRRRVHKTDVADKLIADAKSLAVDHIAITGDLINLGLPAEYAAAHAWLATVGAPDQVTVVPGNHDIYSNLSFDPGVMRWADYMGGNSETLAFPFVRRFGPLALIGLNSALETPPFVAAGELGPEQIEIAADLLERLRKERAVRVVLIHHPPLPHLAGPRRGLRDAHHLERMLQARGADLVLYGHNHRPQTSWLASRDGQIPIIGAASSSAAAVHGEEPLARYNFFTFFAAEEGVRIRQSVRGLAAAGGDVVQISEQFLVP